MQICNADGTGIAPGYQGLILPSLPLVSPALHNASHIPPAQIFKHLFDITPDGVCSHSLSLCHPGNIQC